VDFACPELLYPEGHRIIIRSSARTKTSRRLTVDDVKEFFASWYDPANAIAGGGRRFLTAETLEKIRSYFESNPSRGVPKIPRRPDFRGTIELEIGGPRDIDDAVELAQDRDGLADAEAFRTG